MYLMFPFVYVIRHTISLTSTCQFTYKLHMRLLLLLTVAVTKTTRDCQVNNLLIIVNVGDINLIDHHLNVFIGLKPTN